MRRRGIRLLALLAILASIAIGLLIAGDDGPARPRAALGPPVAAALASSTALRLAGAPAGRTPTSATLAPMPASLRGSDVDGELRLDEHGHLVESAEVIRLFDYFLTTIGELDRAGIRARIADEARHRVPGHEAEVLALFDRYAAYLDDATEAARHAERTPREHLAALRALQASRFGDDGARRLFGTDDDLALAILDSGDVAAREDLSPRDKEAALEAIDARLPPAIAAARARLRAPALVHAQVDAMRAAGASDDEIWAVRARAFGRDAADRLAALDRQRRP